MRIQKKMQILALILALFMSLSACGGNTNQTAKSESVKLTLLWHGNEVLPDRVFGDVIDQPDDNLLVMVNGEQVKDFAVVSAEPEIMRVERTDAGHICLTQLQSFEGRLIGFTLTYAGKDYSFFCNDDSQPTGDVPSQAELPQEMPEAQLNAAEEAAGFDSFEAVEQMATENHAPYTNGNAQESMNIDQYAISDKALLTQTEMVDLRTEKQKANHISVEQAKEDVDLFFRAWKYSYPSYYFMGEEVFLAAKEQALAELEAYPDGLSGAQLGNILYEAMSFLQDEHSSVDGKVPASIEDSLYYVSYLDNAQTFDKDETGYYQIYEGEKWYFTSADHTDLRIVPTLLPSGKVAYCPMLLVPKSEAVHENQMVLVKDGEKKNVTLCWTVSKDVSYTSEIDTQCKAQASGDIYYIDYLDMHSNNGDVNDFLKTAKEAKNYKAVIFDLRHTLGWEHWQLLEWIEMFTGEEPSVTGCIMARDNALRTLFNFDGKPAAIGYENCRITYMNGRETANDIPLIILIDKSCGSSVEEAYMYLKTVDNSVVIGCNTSGCALGGSVQTYYLPHSGVQFAIGGFMEFQGEVKNIDGIGYEPDVWCNPAEVLSSVLMFLQNYGIAGEESVQPLYWQSLPPVALRILWHGNKILPGQVFGFISEQGDIVDVTVDGQLVSDFAVRSEAPERMTAEPTADGKICLTKQKSFGGGPVGLVITYQGKDYKFYCNG